MVRHRRRKESSIDSVVRLKSTIFCVIFIFITKSASKSPDLYGSSRFAPSQKYINEKLFSCVRSQLLRSVSRRHDV